jgi:hypothetical protein
MYDTVFEYAFLTSSPRFRVKYAALLVFAIGCGGSGDLAIDAAGDDGDDAGAPDGAEPDPAPDAAAAPRPLAVASCEDLGALPLPSAVTIGRDGGEGGLLGGRYLWTFGDTFTTVANTIDGSNVLSATSGWASLEQPLVLTEPVGADGIPAQLIPYTAEEIAANQADARNGWALWPVDTGGGEGVVVFQRIKRTNGDGYESMGVGTARITVDATVATRAAADLFAPPDPLFVPITVVGGNVYGFVCAEVGFLNRGCRIARAPAAQADQRAAYRFYDGAEWQTDPATAVVVIDQIGNMPSISANAWLGRYLAVNAPVVSSQVLLRTADHVEGRGAWPSRSPPTASASSPRSAPTPTTTSSPSIPSSAPSTAARS